LKNDLIVGRNPIINSMMLQRIKDHRSNITPPEDLFLTAVGLWKNRKDEFLQTNCELTTYAIRDMLTPDQADTAWTYVDILPEPLPRVFEVIFGELGGEDHFMMVMDGRIYQSYAFEHGVQETQYLPDQPLWKQVSVNSHLFECKPIFFRIGPDLNDLNDLNEINL